MVARQSCSRQRRDPRQSWGAAHILDNLGGGERWVATSDDRAADDESTPTGCLCSSAEVSDSRTPGGYEKTFRSCAPADLPGWSCRAPMIPSQPHPIDLLTRSWIRS